MNVDIGALRKFEEVFGPAIASIPAVIDAVASKNDLERHIAQKQVELQQVMDRIEATKQEGEEFIKTTQARADSMLNAADKKVQDAALEADKVREAAQAARTAAEAKLAEFNARIMEASNKVRDAEDEAAKKLAALDLAHATKVKQLESEVEDLEARRAKAEKSLAALRAKLEV